jgi:hypothetical protein
MIHGARRHFPPNQRNAGRVIGSALMPHPAAG